MAFLTGGTSEIGGGYGGGVGNPIGPVLENGSFYKGSSSPPTIRIEGNLRAESNEFIAGFEKAVNVYNRNVRGTSIGR